ncbi:MAG: sugar ABC transporter permease [bacterium]|nr:sugar ABC transporter permease [bacterium]
MASVIHKKPRPFFRRKAVKDFISALFFLAPALISFMIFMGIPALLTFFICFTKYNIISPMEFVGVRNFLKVSQDPQALKVVGNTVKFILVLVPAHVIVGLLLALGVSRNISNKLKYLYRTAIYFPAITTTASVAVLWGFLYHTEFGAINYYFGQIGIQPIRWLSSYQWVIPSVLIFSLWKFVGNSFLFYFIGLQNIPDSLYEAAAIDGANKMQTFFHITLPMLSPTIFFVLTINLIGVPQIFDEPFLLTKGGPGDASRTIALHIYQKAFQEYNLGYASTFALALFVIVASVTVFQFAFQKKWVNYDYE